MDQYFKVEDKGKSIDFNNLSQSELERRGVVQPQLTGLTNITGDDFEAESQALLSEIETFNKYQTTSSFPKTEVQAGLYTHIHKKLEKLSSLNNESYQDLIRDGFIAKTISRFTALYNDLYRQEGQEPYNEIAQSTIEEQEAWSDRANTPSAHSQILSPIKTELPKF